MLAARGHELPENVADTLFQAVSNDMSSITRPAWFTPNLCQELPLMIINNCYAG